ncbi:MAG TPA: SCO family protein [Thermoanaerobaculia bacterium]|nr:SCO family protein [Thermoanaerobaculia bacterium]
MTRPAFAVRCLLSAVLLLGCHHQSDLPRLFEVPNASLINDAGRPHQLAANKGYVTVYDFIFTNCAASCPVMTGTLRQITAKIPKDTPVRFVSISVDPARDTSAVLAAYAKKVRNDDRWTFLTGDRNSIVKLSVDGFKLAAGGTPQPGGEPLLHSSKFAVADKDGWIRAYYDSQETDVVEHVASTIQELAAD